MTVIVAVKTSDGIVVASDSASSLLAQGQVLNIYNNANKIFNLCKKLSVGAMTSGSGSIGKLSISTIAKDFRVTLSNKNDCESLTIKDIADEFFSFIKDEHYGNIYQPGDPNNPVLNMWVFGFSPAESLPEIWEFSFGSTIKEPHESLNRSDGGLTFGGEPELVQRVMMGYGSALPKQLKQLGVDDNIVNQALLAQRSSEALLHEAMPIQDAIDLADFLVRATIEFSRFKMGAPTVGGPIEIAAITKHEGFKWIKRKHYYDAALNPDLGG